MTIEDADPARSGSLSERFNLGWHCCDRLVEQGLGERPAIHYEDGALSFRALRDLSNRIGNALRSLEIGPRQRFLIRLNNIPAAYATFLAGLKIGAVPIPTPTLLGERELEQILALAEVSLVVTNDELAGPIRKLKSSFKGLRVLCLGNPGRDEVSFEELTARQSASLSPYSTGIDDPAFVLFTSGTTGTPKGIAHAHRAFNIARGNPCGRWGMGLRRDDVVFAPHDIAWSYTLGCGFLYPLSEGASTVAFPGRATPEAVAATIARHEVTIFATVPTLYKSLLRLEPLNRSDFASLRHVMSAGERLPSSVFDEWKQRTGVEILDHIGQAELQMFVANPPGEPPKPGSVGRAVPGYEVAVLDESDRPVLGRIGRLAVREDNLALFYEYIKMPDKWSACHRSGWYLTGDLASVDEEGYFWYVSRDDDVITTRGYLVSPGEVEETLMEHDAVKDVAVVGAPSADLGQAVVAYIVLREEAEFGADVGERLREYVKSRIAPFKAPKEIIFVKSLPRTPTGKVMRRTLRATAASSDRRTEGT